MIVPVDASNIHDAAVIHSVSWQESHRSFCNADFVALHTPEHQEEYLLQKMNEGSRVFMLIHQNPVGIVSLKDTRACPDISIVRSASPIPVLKSKFRMRQQAAFQFLYPR